MFPVAGLVADLERRKKLRFQLRERFHQGRMTLDRTELRLHEAPGGLCKWLSLGAFDVGERNEEPLGREQQAKRLLPGIQFHEQATNDPPRIAICRGPPDLHLSAKGQYEIDHPVFKRLDAATSSILPR